MAKLTFAIEREKEILSNFLQKINVQIEEET